MDIVTPHATAKVSKVPPPGDDRLDVYVWKPARPRTAPLQTPLSAKSPKAPPPRDPLPSAPVVPLAAPPSWARIWRSFLAGAIMGVAAIKAAELLMHRDHPHES